MNNSEQLHNHNFSQRELASVVQVVDTNLKGSDVIIGSVTAENLDGFVDEFIKFREQRRQNLNLETCHDMSVVELVAEKRGRSCEPHAIQCDIQGAQDASFIVSELEKRNSVEGVLELHQLILFFKREIKLRTNLAEFHRIDISRRIGDFKKDASFFDKERQRFEKALPILFKLLKQFEKENLEKINSLPDGDRDEVVNDLKNLRNISVSDFDSLKSSFYEDVCERIGRLINMDWEMNVKNLMSAAETLWKLDSRNLDLNKKRGEYINNFDPANQVLAAFCFDHGIVEVRERYTDLSDALSWLLNYSASAASDFLSVSASFSGCPALSLPGQIKLMEIKAKRTLESQ